MSKLRAKTKWTLFETEYLLTYCCYLYVGGRRSDGEVINVKIIKQVLVFCLRYTYLFHPRQCNQSRLQRQTASRPMCGITSYCHCCLLQRVHDHYMVHGVLLGTVENHGKKWQKTRQTFVKIAKNHGKDTASNHGPEDHYTVYKTQGLALTTIMTCSARFSSVKFCRCSKIQRQKNTYSR